MIRRARSALSFGGLAAAATGDACAVAETRLPSQGHAFTEAQERNRPAAAR